MSTWALPAVVGLASHQHFKQHEPTIASFALYSAAALTAYAGAASLTSTFRPIAGAGTATNAACALVIQLVVLASSIVYYRVLSSSHPLHHIPGPLVAKVTQGWILRHVMRGNPRRVIQALHESRKCDVVRLGPNEVSIRNAGAVLQITGGKSWQKGPSYDASATGTGAGARETSLIALRDHKLHAARRRLWEKAFSLNSLQSYQPAIQVRISELTAALRKHEGETIDLHRWLGFFVYDVMTDLAFGGGSSMITTEDDKGILHDISATFSVSGLVKIAPWLAPVWRYHPDSKVLARFREYAKNLFLLRVGRNVSSAEHSDVFSHLLANDGSTTKLTQKELAADSMLVVMGGADTTRTVLTSIFRYMLRDAPRWAELRTVIDCALSGQDGLSHSDLAHLPLLNAYINEALRLNPPIPFSIQRVVPDGGMTVAGVWIPGGTTARLSTFAIHHDERYFENPEEFLPERWLPSNKPQALNGPKESFLPFIYGPYHCVGKQFALQEIRLLLATIVYNFDVEAAPGFDLDAFERSWIDRSITDIPTSFDVVLRCRRPA